MNSFRTHDDTLAALAAYDDLAVDGLDLDFVQSQEPKLRADDLSPVKWPADPSLEWCPPGHGDLYTSLVSSGVLDRLISLGYRYALVSNSDNLGAAPDATLAGWFAASGAPYAAEVCRRTAADRKGGHLAIRKADQRLILRDTAQTAKEEMDYFTDEHRHPYFHTNNLWFDLQALARILAERNAVLGLPLIKNVKTVDPADPESPEVIQIESAMGAAVEVFEGATAIGVGRERFLPVKTTNDLLLLRSDVYSTGDDGRMIKQEAPAPLVDLDPTVLQDDRRLRAAVPGRRAVAVGRHPARGAGGLDLRGWCRGGRGRGPGRCRRAADGAGRLDPDRGGRLTFRAPPDRVRSSPPRPPPRSEKVDQWRVLALVSADRARKLDHGRLFAKSQGQQSAQAVRLRPCRVTAQTAVTTSS